MTLEGLKEKALEARRERAAEEAAKENRQREEQAARSEAFKREVVTWMVGQGMEAQELQKSLSVEEVGYSINVNLPGHETVSFGVVRDQDGITGINKITVRYPDGYPVTVHSLGEALLAAEEFYKESLEQAEREARREAEREARREQAKAEAAERGRRYMALLEEYPILEEMLSILAIYIEDHEQFADDLAAAEEWSVHVESSLRKKLATAKGEATDAYEEARRLESDLYEEREAHDETKRKGRRGW